MEALFGNRVCSVNKKIPNSPSSLCSIRSIFWLVLFVLKTFPGIWLVYFPFKTSDGKIKATRIRLGPQAEVNIWGLHLMTSQFCHNFTTAGQTGSAWVLWRHNSDFSDTGYFTDHLNSQNLCSFYFNRVNCPTFLNDSVESLARKVIPKGIWKNKGDMVSQASLDR